MITKLLAPIALIGAAAAVTLAPSAAATTTSCQETARSSICQRPGHSSIYASPAEVVQQQQLLGVPGGIGPVAPILSMN